VSFQSCLVELMITFKTTLADHPFSYQGFLPFLVFLAFLVAYAEVTVQSSTVKHVVSN